MAAFANWGSVLSRLKGMLRRQGCVGDDADDLIQDACLKLAHYELTHEVVHPDAFLLRAARNLAIDAHRVRRNHGQTVLIEEAEAEVAWHVQSASPTEDAVLDWERTARVLLVLDELPPLTRELFVAHLFNGKSYPEIASSHGLGVRTVRTHVSKAILILMRRLEGG
jgi:RNA polymerase sigma-70 factor (ECF subfamily)